MIARHDWPVNTSNQVEGPRQGPTPPLASMAVVATPGSGTARLTRAAAFAAAVLASTIAVHVAAGGAVPAPGVVLAVGLGLGAPSAWLTARRRPARLTTTVLAAGQLSLHRVFSVLEGPTLACTGPGAGHVHAGTVHCGGATELALGMAPQHHEWLMVAGHVGATLALAWLLAHGQEALWRLADWVRFRIPESAPRVNAGPACLVGYAPDAPHVRVGGRRHGSRAPPARMRVARGLAAA